MKTILLVLAGFMAMAGVAHATLTTDQIYLLNNKMGYVPHKIQLGTLLQNVEAVANSALADGKVWIGNGAGTATAVTLSGDVTTTNAGVTAIGTGKVTTGTILDGTIGKVDLAAAIRPSHVIKFAGEFTTVGGDATESIPVVGAAATDICMVTVKTKGAVPVSIVEASCGLNAIAVTTSANPAADHVLYYTVTRAVP